jgi:hypothetical protein
MKIMSVIHRLYLPVLMFGAILSFFGCLKNKSKTPKNVEAWLELHFPQKFDVLSSGSNFDIVNFFTGKRQSVLADRADSTLQFVIYWQKGSEDFGLTDSTVEQEYQAAKTNTQRARDFHKRLKNKGLEQFSIGMNGDQAYLLIYEEPSRAARTQALAILKSVLDAQQELPADQFQISYMEPAAYQIEFKEIIPNWNWKRPDGWYHNNCILSLDFDATKGIKPEKLGRLWTINTSSERTTPYQEDAFKYASEWAAQHLSKPYYLEPEMVEFSALDNMSIRFRFPYYKTKPETEGDSTSTAEPIGWVAVHYQAEEKKCTKISKEDY